jgi:hypothetical protein
MTDPVRFGAPGCTCRSFTTDPPRFLDQPGDTIDRNTSWQRGQDCVHHAGEAERDEEAGSGGPEDLTAEEARDLVDELGLQLYRAQDALAFVEECCVIAEREGRAITTADVREWLKGARCGRQLLADRPASSEAGE